MPRRRARPTSLDESLGRARRRLTAWHAVTLLAILTLLGGGLFATITAYFDDELDQALVDDARELERVVMARDGAGRPAVVDTVTDIRIPGRELYLLDSLGHEVSGLTPSAWVETLGRDAWVSRALSRTQIADRGRILRGHAESFTTPRGRPLVAVAVADEIELEDRYASLIAIFSILSLAAIVLVSGGGWVLARKTTAPVEAAFAHMRRFMADAAHELRTPITIIRGRAEVALQRPRDADEYAQALRAVEQDSVRVGRIVEDLLMLARADAGERPIERRRVFLDDVALDAASAARVIAANKSVNVEVGDFDETAVEGDATLLRQLVLILLDNAIKFSQPNGEVRVSVSATQGVPTLTVSDTGIGIPQDHLPRVFDRFFRGDASRTRISNEPSVGASEGAGLGLSIARWIADEHGAAITIDSQVGQGTRVVVQFPSPTRSPNDSVSSS